MCVCLTMPRGTLCLVRNTTLCAVYDLVRDTPHTVPRVNLIS